MLYVYPMSLQKNQPKMANLLMCEEHYIRVQSIKKNPQTLDFKGH